nr:cohesin domain-containing protein [Halovivax limisalsi]
MGAGPQGPLDSASTATDEQASIVLESVSVGDESATVSVSTDASSVAGYGANVTFDPDVVQVESVTGVDMSDPVTNINNEQGWVFFTQSQASGVDAPELAQIEFSVQQSVDTELEFVGADTTLNDDSSPPEDIPIDQLVGTTLDLGDGGEEPPENTFSLVAGEQEGDQISVTARTDAADVAGYGAEVTFDPSVVEVASVSGIDMSDPVVNVDNANGSVFFTQSQASGIDSPELAEITFDVVSTGETELSFVEEETSLNDGSSPPEPIPFEPEGTTIAVEDDGGEEPPENTFSLEAGEQDGDQITVTAQTNAGSVAGYGANVTFDPSVVEVASVSGVDMSDPVTNVDNENGWVFFTQSQASGVDEPELAEITFDVVETGETELSFVEADTSLNDDSSPPEPIPFEPEGTTISVEDDGGEEPPTDTLSLVAGEQDGDQISVTAETTVANTAGYQATVTFDPSVVEVASVSGVDMADPVTNVDNEAGEVSFTQSQAEGVDAPTLAEITFDVVATGETDLEFVAEDTLVNNEDEQVPVDLEGTTISVEDDGGEEPPENTFSLEAGEQEGDQISVTAQTTVENTAGYQANVTFDPDVVEVASVSGVDMSDPTTNVNNEDGWVFFTQSQASGIDSPELAEITFDVVATGETDLEFVAEDTLVNNEDEQVPVDLEGTTISVEDDGGEEPPENTFSLEAGEQEGDQISVTAQTNAGSVAGYGANVTFDPSVVEVASVSGIDMSDPVVNIDNENGWVFFTQSQASGIDAPELAEITFDVVATGETDLSFVEGDTTLNDDSSPPEDIPFEPVGTTISVEDDGGEEPPENTFSLEAGEQEGDQITVTAQTDAADVAGYGANVTFDPSVVEVASVSGVDMSDPVVNIDNENGWVFFTQSQASGIDEPELAEITFDVVATGETDLEFVEADTSLNDGSSPPEDIPFEPEGTTISVEDDGGEEPPTDTLSLEAGEQDGDQIGVAVETTVANTAGYQATVTFDPSVVEVASVSGVDMADPVTNIDNEAGEVSFTQSQAEGVDAPTLAEITFDVVATGETDLEFVAEDTLVNNEDEQVPVDLEGTTISVEDDGGEEPPENTFSLEAGEQDGDQITVTAQTNASDVAGYGAEVTFDPSVVEVADVSGIDMSDPVTNVDNENGSVFFTQSQASGIDSPELAEITFDVVATGETELSFVEERTSLNDGQSPPEPIPFEPVGTTISVEDDGGEEPPENTFSLEAGEQEGDQITVTAQTNAGSVAGYGANVTFDPSVVEVASVSGIDMSDPVTNVNNENGWVFFTQSQASGVDAPELAEITFDVVATGETDLSFVGADTTLNDDSSPPEDIPFEPVGTTISVEDDGGEEPPENTFSLEAGEQDGDQISVTARTDAADVAGYGAEVTFDPSVVEVASVSGVDMSDPVTNVDNENGSVFFTQSQASGIDAPELAEITFDVVATGETELSFVEEETSLNDGSSPPEPIPFEPVGTTISVEDDGGEEPPENTFSLEAGEQDGDQISVTAETTVANTAGYQATVTFDPSVVEVASVSGVDMADPVTNVDNEAGEVSFTQSQAEGVDAPTLAEITFDVVATGETDLEFVAEDTLVNNEDEQVPVDLEGTTISVEDDGGEEPPENTFSLEAGEQEGDQISVTARTNAADVAGYGAEVTFDPSVVEVADVSGIDMSDPVTNVDNENGSVFFTQSQASGIDAPELAEITFDVVATGETDLEFVEKRTSLNDGQSPPEDIPFEPVGTTISVEDDGGEEPPENTFSLEAGEQEGDQITVTAQTNADDVAGYGANVTFDPSVVEVASVSGVDMSDPTTNVNNEDGWVFFTQSQASGIDSPELAEITFDVAATGETELSFVGADTTLNDGQSPPEDIPFEPMGTSIQVEASSSSGGVYLPPPKVENPASFQIDSVELSATSVTVGESITLRITVSNTGDVEGQYEFPIDVGSTPVSVQELTLGGGETTTIEVSHAFESAGTVTLSVDGTAVGDVAVTESTAGSSASAESAENGSTDSDGAANDDGADDGASSDGDAESDSVSPNGTDGMPGFAAASALIALFATALIARFRIGN